MLGRVIILLTYLVGTDAWRFYETDFVFEPVIRTWVWVSIVSTS